MPLFYLFKNTKHRKQHAQRLLKNFTPILLLLFLLAALIIQAFQQVEASAMEPVPFLGTLTPYLAMSILQSEADQQQHIPITVGLRPRDQGKLLRYAYEVLDPSSQNYRRFLTPEEYRQTFSPSESDYTALASYLQGQGFTITQTHQHRLTMSFQGPVKLVENAFRVKLDNFLAPEGYTYYANTLEPQLPRRFAGAILNISGLNNAARWRHASVPQEIYVSPQVSSQDALAPPQDARIPHPGHLGASLHVGANAKQGVSCPGAGSNYMTPQQVAAAYNLQGLYNAGFQGEGQHIALFELNTVKESDLRTYMSCFGQSTALIETIVTGSSPVPTDGGAIEVALDSELILSAAPRLSKLTIYQAANNSADVLAEWSKIIEDAVPIVSTSWGLCEASTDPQMIQQENILFATAVTQGQSIFAASGDSGSAGCYYPHATQSTQLSAGDPGTQPFVTSVGGTSLSMSSVTAYGQEIAWNSPSSMASFGGASGGGISKYWAAPDWQSAPGVRNGHTTAQTCKAALDSFCRQTPDVALHADAKKGYIIYCTVPQASCDAQRPWSAVGGTSAGAPLWAAFTAMANQMARQKGGTNLGFLNPLLYRIGNDPLRYASSFHDVTRGTNDFNNLNRGRYPATPGYDMATGLGSFNALQLATHLVTLAPQRTPGNTGSSADY